MADLAISYAHGDIELARAITVLLAGERLQVWIDSPNVDSESIAGAGIPGGQDHWQLIEAEFAAASMIVVLDTPAWRSSADCQRELDLCQKYGKAVSYVGAEDVERALDAVLLTLTAHEKELSAHARLAARAVEPEPSLSLLQKLVSHRTASDANVVLASVDSPVTVTPTLQAVIDSDFAIANEVRTGLRRFFRFALAFLVVVTVSTVVLWLFASRWASDAEASEADASARALANDSRLATDTLEAVALARTAVALDPTSSNYAALQAASTRDARLRMIDLPPEAYLGAAWAIEEPIVLVYSNDAITPVNVNTGVVGSRVQVEEPIRPGTLNAGPDGQSAVYITWAGDLQWIDLAASRSAVVAAGPVTALVLTETGSVVWGKSDGALRIAGYPVGGKVLTAISTVFLPSIVRAVDVDGDAVATVSDDGVIRLLRSDVGTFSIVEETRVSDLVGSSSAGYRNAITICGSLVVGRYSWSSLLGTSFEWTPGISKELQTIDSLRITAPLCTPAGALFAPALSGDIASFDGTRTIFDDGSLYWRIAARDPLDSRIAYVSPTPARLVVANPGALPIATDIGPVAALIQFEHRTLFVGVDNAVRDLASGEYLGALGSAYPALEVTAVLGCDALLGASDGVFHVGCDGTVARVVDAASLYKGGQKFTGLRAASDGVHFVLTRSESVAVLDQNGAVNTEMTMPWLQGDAVAEADVSPDGSTIAVVTVFGHVYRFPATEYSGVALPDAEFLSIVTAGNSNAIAFHPSGDLVVVSSDGRILRISPEGGIVATGRLGLQPDAIFVSADEVVASSILEGSIVLSAIDLAMIDSLDRGFLITAGAGGERYGILRYSSGEAGGEVELGATWLVSLPRSPSPLGRYSYSEDER